MTRKLITVGGKNVTYSDQPSPEFPWGYLDVLQGVIEGGERIWFKKRAIAKKYADEVQEAGDAEHGAPVDYMIAEFHGAPR